MSNKNYIIKKIILVGDAGVGKSSLFLKYDSNKFLDNYNATIGVDYIFKNIEKEDKNVNLRLQIYDTAGQERYRSLIPNYIKNSDGIFLIFDLTKKQTFNDLGKWLELIEEQKKIDKNNLIILGNKFDLVDSREVTDKDIDLFKNNHDFKIFNVSAKSKENLDECFEEMINLIIENMDENEIGNNNSKKLKNNKKNGKCCM